MLDVIFCKGKPIKMWLKNVEEGALEQAKNAAKLPFTALPVALMPDCHQGYGVPIGCVWATEDVVVPNAVGVDIGCTDKDTEFLSPDGWIKISKYNNEQVMQNQKDLVKIVTKLVPIEVIKG